MLNLQLWSKLQKMAGITKDTESKPYDIENEIANFEFLPPIDDDDTDNGLFLNGCYIPEEVLTIILSHVDPKHLLKLSQVCKKWCRIIKSHVLWSIMYERKNKRKAKKLPWYVYYCYFATEYFDKNLLKNGNGQWMFNHWKIIKNYGDEFKIEKEPNGADPLPLDVPDFNGRKSCFATSYYECNKLQEIDLTRNRLFLYILNKYRPHIYVSEWVTARNDCGSVYKLVCRLTNKEKEYNLYEKQLVHRFEQWEGSSWIKKEIYIKDYPFEDECPYYVTTIVFQHEGRDTQFWKGHYGCKMAGGVVKILFDTIEPKEE